MILVRKILFRPPENFGAGFGTVRLLGSFALGISYVAAGRKDLYFHHRLQPYDQAAGFFAGRRSWWSSH
ncbi:MAG: hypothetical protein CM1200mP3_05110 [Chloroflexota bacterium]|nr:MAG: hypothetical protein CM1200mP3_05110 [Chloroflexota bacterium]